MTAGGSWVSEVVLDELDHSTRPETVSTCSYLFCVYSLMPMVPDAGEPVSFMSVGPLAPS